jgi:hypothetical protein
MWIAWLSRRLPRRDSRQALPAAGGYLDGGGAVAGGEPVPVAEAGHVADVTDDRGGDDRAHPEQPGQAGAGRPDRGGGFRPGLADPGVEAAQILGQLGGELPAGRGRRPRWRDRLPEPGGLACGDLAGHAAGHQLAQHLVQPAGHLGTHPAQVPVALGARP